MDKVNAALIFFTRLPIWKCANPPQSAYKDVVVYWPYVGWIGGTLAAVVMKGCSIFMPWIVALLLAIVCRLRLTGALHEDGLADYCDGFGCGGGKSRILGIMKDSHIGTYGVLGLIMYFALLIAVLYSLPPEVAASGFVAADAYGKFCAAQITNILPYARPEGAKNGITYSRMSTGNWIVCLIGGILPIAVVGCFMDSWNILYAAILPPIVMLGMVVFMRRRIDGYTGDCCGAVCLLCELSFLLMLSIIYA